MVVVSTKGEAYERDQSQKNGLDKQGGTTCRSMPKGIWTTIS